MSSTQSTTTVKARATKRQVTEAARVLRGAIGAAYCRTDEYEDPDAALRELREHRAALALLVRLATRGVEAQP